MDVKASLMGSIDEILDKMTFMFFEEVEEPHTGDEFQFITQVRMRGVIQGTLNLLVTEDTAKYIARNLIGIRDDDELFEDTLGDALMEFTNLVAGRMMTLLNPAGPFDMEVPHIVDGPADPEDGLSLLDINGTLDDQPFRVVLHYQQQ